MNNLNNRIVDNTSIADFFALIRLGVGNLFTQTSPNPAWTAIRSMAEQQGLYAVVLDGIERLPTGKRPPQEILLEWIGEVLQS